MFIMADSIPMMRSDQARERLLIIGVVAREITMPPTPEPALFIEFANERLLSNHWDVIPTLGMKRKPTPRPTRMPCVI